MQIEQRPHVTPGPTADELEREQIRRRLEEFEREPVAPTPVPKVVRMSVVDALRRFGWNYRAIGLVMGLSIQRVSEIDDTVVPLRRTPRRPDAPELEQA